MDYKEFQVFETSFDNFITKLKSKGQIEIQYHFIKGRIHGYDFSFSGYRTTTGWHGIHYCKQKNCYYFGTRELKFWYPRVKIDKSFTTNTARITKQDS